MSSSLRTIISAAHCFRHPNAVAYGNVGSSFKARFQSWRDHTITHPFEVQVHFGGVCWIDRNRPNPARNATDMQSAKVRVNARFTPGPLNSVRRFDSRVDDHDLAIIVLEENLSVGSRHLDTLSVERRRLRFAYRNRSAHSNPMWKFSVGATTRIASTRRTFDSLAAPFSTSLH